LKGIKVMLNTSKTVREFAIELPNATRVFEELGIDYCCGGKRPLAEACTVAGVNIERVITSLELAAKAGSSDGDCKIYQKSSLKELISYILDKHHVFTRKEIERLKLLLAKVCLAHGQMHPELFHLQSVFSELASELEVHMHKEEQVLFPYIIRLEDARSLGSVPVAPFGTIRNPIRVMSMEHDAAGDLLRKMRDVSSDYTVPPNVCLSYQTLYGAMKEFEADLHQHIHLENNLLFPQAIEMEEALG
jgi:regulator of cell morphogenesis and NO signaling